jgi:cell division protein FtsQ
LGKLFSVLFLVLLGAIGWFICEHPEWFELESVKFSGDFVHLSEADLADRVAPLLVGSLLRLDVVAIGETLQAEPWVERVVVKRHLPKRLVIKVKERVPVARWGDHALVDSRGDVFSPQHVEDFPGELISISGDERDVQAILAKCMLFRERLSLLEGCHVDGRGSWRLQLSGGVAVMLGRHDMVARAGVLADIFGRLKKRFPRAIKRIDMRYQHGLVLA